MNLRNLSGYIPVIIIFYILAIPSGTVLAKEDTAYLLFKKKTLSKNKPYQYVIRKGDIVTNIIRVQLGVKGANVYRILHIVKQLNPKIKNINRVYPGQKLILPGRDGMKAVMKGGTFAAGKGTTRVDTRMEIISRMPAKNHLPAIRHAINRLEGSVITDGNYYIPIPPTGQVTINCSMVPIVEMDDGSRILLDFSSQIPDDVKKMIESTWRNYSFVNDDTGIISALKKVIDTSKTYTFKKFGKYANVGKAPDIKILIDWLISEKITLGRKPHLHGLNLVEDQSSLLPSPIKKYAEKNELTITEVIAKSGLSSAGEENYPLPDLPAINSGTNRELAVSLLTSLGYTPAKNAEVKVFDSARDGFNLSVKADLLIETEDNLVIINFQKIPQHFINIFKKRGTKIVFATEGEEKKEVVKKVFYAMNIPFSAGNFKFLVPGKADKPRAIISLPAIKVTIDKNATYHFVDFDVDDEINRFLYKKWGVNLIKY